MQVATEDSYFVLDGVWILPVKVGGPPTVSGMLNLKLKMEDKSMVKDQNIACSVSIIAPETSRRGSTLSTLYIGLVHIITG